MLIAARFVQGVGGAVSSAVILAMIVNLFPEPNERAKAFGILSFIASAGAAVGLLAAAVLVVNNLRDIDSDRRIGKNTLAVRCGRSFTSWEYAALLHAPFLLAALVAALEGRAALLSPLVLLPWATVLARRVWRKPAGAWLNAALGATAKLGLTFAVLLSLAAALAG
jgi:1,4-dihydroxy-2-naphthoate octaprenyltransferase